MNKDKFFGILFVVGVGLLVSIYFSSRKISQSQNGPKEQVVVIDTPTPTPTPAFSPVQKDPGVQRDQVAQKDQHVQKDQADPAKLEMAKVEIEKLETGPKEKPNCELMPEFKKLKTDLGLMINKQDGNFSEFLEQINQFRNENGLPIPMLISSDKLEKQNIVYNNCRSSCGGDVHEVFVNQILNRKYVNALTQEGKFFKLALGRGGVELATVDELSNSGVPFRSWPMPASESDWYVFGADLFYRLDIPGIWLKANPDMTWEVVAKPKTALHLEAVQDALSVKGCSLNEKCFQAGPRHFKAPNLCAKN